MKGSESSGIVFIPCINPLVLQLPHQLKREAYTSDCTVLRWEVRVHGVCQHRLHLRCVVSSRILLCTGQQVAWHIVEISWTKHLCSSPNPSENSDHEITTTLSLVLVGWVSPKIECERIALDVLSHYLTNVNSLVFDQTSLCLWNSWYTLIRPWGWINGLACITPTPFPLT